MSLSSVFIYHNDDLDETAKNQTTKQKAETTLVHEIDLEQFYTGFENLCIYNPVSSHKEVTLTEYAP